MPSRSWILSAAIAVLAVVASACAPADATTDSQRATLADTQLSKIVASTTTTTAAPTTTTTTTTTTAAPTTTTTEAPDPYATLVATARPSVTQLIAYTSPNGAPMVLEFIVPNPHQFGGPLTLSVLEGAVDDDWLKVLLPVRPNGQVGWIPADDYLVTSTRVRAEVDLASRKVTVFDGPDIIVESAAAIGTARTPTPLGTFFIAAKRVNPPAERFLGTHALVLSGFSETLETFSGGLPVIAIHGSNYPNSVLGRAVSNGCVRVPNDIIQFMDRHVPLGAPVHISG